MSHERKMATVRYHAAEYARLTGIDPAVVLDARLPGQCEKSKAARAAAFRIADALGISIPDLVGVFHCMRNGDTALGCGRHPWRQFRWSVAA